MTRPSPETTPALWLCLYGCRSDADGVAAQVAYQERYYAERYVTAIREHARAELDALLAGQEGGVDA